MDFNGGQENRPSTKTQEAIGLYRDGNFKRAFKIFKTFKLTFQKEYIRLIEIAYESLCGKTSFYQSLGIDTDKTIQQAKSLINKTYLS